MRDETVREDDYRDFESHLSKGVKWSTYSQWASSVDEGARGLGRQRIQCVHLPGYARPSVEKIRFGHFVRNRKLSSEDQGSSKYEGHC